MKSKSPDLRFGIRVGGLRSRTWRVRSGAVKPELFLEREGLEKAAHVSLHESGSWHYKTNKHASVRWTRPAEMAEGFTRAVLIIQPVAVATMSLADPEDAKILEVDEDSDAVNFDVFIERPGVDLSGWPGRTPMGTALVGRIPLAGGAGWCSVVVRQAPLSLDPIEFPRPDQETLEKMQEAADQDGLYMTSVHDVSDGAMAFVDSRVVFNAHS